MHKTLLIAAALSAAALANATYIVNGGFETGSPGTISVMRSPWYSFYNSPDTLDTTGINGFSTVGYDFDGAGAGEGTVFARTINIGSYIEGFGQTMTTAITGGTEITIGALLASELNQGGAYNATVLGGIDVFLYDGVTTQFVGALAASTAVRTWQSRSLTFVAPTGTWTDIVFSGQATAGDISQTAIDAINVEVVPEPATLLALGAGLAALARRRRK